MRTGRLRWVAKGSLAVAGWAAALGGSLQGAPPELKTQGNLIVVKATGRPVRLTGVNIPSLEWSPYAGENIAASITQAATGWKANVIRLPVKQGTWLAGGAYLAKVDAAIDQASAANLYVILDLHGYKQPDTGTTAFWSSAAARYKNHPAVLFGLFNEPHSITWDVWKNGDASHPGMQALVNTVRATGAKNIVLAGGLDWAYNISGVLNGYALSDTTGNGIVYDSHLYPWKSYWQSYVGNVAQTFPVLLGEFGHPGGTTFNGLSFEHDSTWVPKAMNWVDTHNLHWTGWSLHPTAKPCLISDWNYTPTSFWGSPAKARLTAYPHPTAVRVVGGTVIGTPGTRTNPGSGVLTDWRAGAVAAFVGGPGHFFDAPTASGSWTGLDLVRPHRITKIEYMPRQNYGSRMVGGVFQGSNDPAFASGVATLLTVTAAPDASGGVYTAANVSHSGTYRYVRYLGPANAYCNVDEIRFYGYGEIEAIVDNADPAGVAITGSWTASAGAGGYYGSNYLHDGNSGKGSKSVRFTPTLPLAGNYEVFARWSAHSNRASNAPIDIATSGGTQYVQVNQRSNGGVWVSLGTYGFHAGTGGSVLIHNSGANGYVVADAVRFVKTNP